MDNHQIIFGDWFPEGTSFDEKRLTISIPLTNEDGDTEILTFQCGYAVCHLCGGRGYTVAIDDDDDDGIDFPVDEDHHSYNASCSCCRGQRVIPEISRPKNQDTELAAKLQKLDNWIKSEEDFRLIQLEEDDG